jgi:hypothetical protein
MSRLRPPGVFVILTNDELMIARHTARLLAPADGDDH